MCLWSQHLRGYAEDASHIWGQSELQSETLFHQVGRRERREEKEGGGEGEHENLMGKIVHLATNTATND